MIYLASCSNCPDPREWFQLCSSRDSDCPPDRPIKPTEYANVVCQKYRSKYPNLLSGKGKQLTPRNGRWRRRLLVKEAVRTKNKTKAKQSKLLGVQYCKVFCLSLHRKWRFRVCRRLSRSHLERHSLSNGCIYRRKVSFRNLLWLPGKWFSLLCWRSLCSLRSKRLSSSCVFWWISFCS